MSARAALIECLASHNQLRDSAACRAAAAAAPPDMVVSGCRATRLHVCRLVLEPGYCQVRDELPIDGGAAKEQQKVGGGGPIQIGPQAESGIQQGDDFRVPLPPQHLAPLADGDGVWLVPRRVDDLVQAGDPGGDSRVAGRELTQHR